MIWIIYWYHLVMVFSPVQVFLFLYLLAMCISSKSHVLCCFKVLTPPVLYTTSNAVTYKSVFTHFTYYDAKLFRFLKRHLVLCCKMIQMCTAVVVTIQCIFVLKCI